MEVLRRAPAAVTAEPGFAECYAASFRGLAVQLYVYTGDLDAAHDLVQEAFCRALARWSTLARYDDPVAWVRRVAFNLAKSRWQRARTALKYLRQQRVEHVGGPNPDRVAVVAALAKLPAGQRRAVVLHYLADLSVAEIAEQEGVAVGTVKSWLHRGRAALAVLTDDRVENAAPGVEAVVATVRRRRRVRAAAAGALTVVLLAGTVVGSALVRRDEGPATNPAEVWREFVACARGHGWPDWPDPIVDSDGRATFLDTFNVKEALPAVEADCGAILDRLPPEVRPPKGSR
jgi:RNA polymerase sigma-70 factor, ECF subfamily